MGTNDIAKIIRNWLMVGVSNFPLAPKKLSIVIALKGYKYSAYGNIGLGNNRTKPTSTNNASNIIPIITVRTKLELVSNSSYIIVLHINPKKRP